MEGISIVIPAYNEARRIAPTLRRVDDYLKKRGGEYEIIVVDDGSTDRTAEIVTETTIPSLTLLRAAHLGKGAATKLGVLAAKNQWILMTDADLSTPIEELDTFLTNGSPVVIGSRALRESKIISHQPRYREYGGKIINLFVRALVLPDIHDTQCGFKLFRADAAKRIFQKCTIPGFGFDIEILFIARLLGYHIAELPIRWMNSPESKVQPFRNGLTILADLLRIRLNEWKGVYN